MKRVLLGLFALTLISACSNESAVPGTKDCVPKAVANAGPSFVYIAKDQDPKKPTPIPDAMQLGADLEKGLEPHWTPEEGLDNPNIARPMASPEHDTEYHLTVRSPRCGTEAHAATMVKVLREGRRADSFSVIIGGKTYPTGYVESWLEHYRQRYVHIGSGRMSTIEVPKELVLHYQDFFVNSQPEGSCWAEAARSSGQMTYHYITGKHVHVSAQDVINCSGFGTASGGGQIAIDRFLPPGGLVDIATLPYDGHDHKCTTKNGPFFASAKRTFIGRNATGGPLDWPSLKLGQYVFGSAEICGSAGALGNGGWVKNPGGGSTNHCYATAGFLLGELHGQTPGEYLPITNSWAAKWGGGPDLFGGQGAYDIRASDGIKLRSAVLTENKFMEIENPCPAPQVDPGEDASILQIFDKDGNPLTPQSAQVGTPAVGKQKYLWSVDTGDKSAKIEKTTDAMPVVTPARTTKMKVEVTNECSTASAYMTIHVWREDHATGRTYLVE